MEGKGRSFLNATWAEMRLSCFLEKMSTAQAIRLAMNFDLLPAGPTDNLFLGGFKE
jgi:hypothetical protein